jgi:hypothetical protein
VNREFHPQGITSPLGDKFTPGGQLHPLGSKFAPRGQVKNGPLLPVNVFLVGGEDVAREALERRGCAGVGHSVRCQPGIS